MKSKLLLLPFLLLISTALFAQNVPIGFQENILASKGSLSKSIYADVDADGDMDVISTNFTEIDWYENIDGQGHFGSAKPIGEEMGFLAFDVEDLDNDGDIDVAFTSYDDGKIGWYENNGQGFFGTSQTIDIVSRAFDISIDDINGDGNLDVIAAGDVYVKWYENINGQGIFGIGKNINSSQFFEAHYLSTEDLDNDGDVDVFFQDNALYWFENTDGQGNFGNVQYIWNASDSRYMSAVDIDNDGDKDILSYQYLQNDLVWYKNDGQGNFGYRIPITSALSMQSAFPFDIDEDGDLDIFIEKDASPNALIAWYENDGQGNFGTEQLIASFLKDAANLENIDFGDIDGDSDADLLYSSGTIIYWLENLDGQGSFGESEFVSLDIPSECFFNDMDNDGDMDMFTSGDILASWENINGQGFFVPKQAIVLGNNYGTTKYGDIDTDGDMDMLFQFNSNIQWYENMGLGNFNLQPNLISLPPGVDMTSLLDLDNDMDIDIVAKFSNDIVWFENTNGQANFAPQQTLITNNNLYITSDMDGDNDKDIVGGDDNDLYWFANNGQGVFGAPQTITSSLDYSSFVYSKDMDGDNDKDIVAHSWINSNLIVWYENTNGNGNFWPSHIIVNTNQASSIFPDDVDGDGDIDVIVGFDELVWYENTGGGNFGAAPQIISSYLKQASYIGTEDINNDGNNDIIAISKYFGPEKLSVFENLGYLGNQIYGNIRLDSNANGCTPTDVPVPNIMVSTDNGANTFSTFTLTDGSYQLNTNPGNFTTTINNTFPSYFSISPNFYSSNFTGLGNMDTGDFCVTPANTVNDVNIALYPLNDARPGFDAEYQLVYRNMGSTVLNGTVELTYDTAKLTFVNASENVSSQTNNTLSFNYSNLNPFETRTIDVKFTVATPPTTNINDVLAFTAKINPITGDNTQNDNTALFDQIVIGSYDPNDIRVVEGDEIYLSEADEYLHYIIRFQNTGTASALSVRVANELGPKLNWDTFQLENASHSNRVEIKNGNQVVFIFQNINLPDSTSNEPASHGFIQYKIKPKSNVAINDIISNTANIFFDFNPPITTNTATTTIVPNLSVAEHSANQVVIFPIPSSGILNIKSTVPVTKVQLYNHLGQRLMNVQKEEGVRSINIEKIPQGIYFVKMEDVQGNLFVKKVVKN